MRLFLYSSEKALILNAPKCDEITRNTTHVHGYAAKNIYLLLVLLVVISESILQTTSVIWIRLTEVAYSPLLDELLSVAKMRRNVVYQLCTFFLTQNLSMFRNSQVKYDLNDLLK
jgi:hypothetical protein